MRANSSLTNGYRPVALIPLTFRPGGPERHPKRGALADYRLMLRISEALPDRPTNEARAFHPAIPIGPGVEGAVRTFRLRAGSNYG
jgi:hypothetical protein